MPKLYIPLPKPYMGVFILRLADAFLYKFQELDFRGVGFAV